MTTAAISWHADPHGDIRDHTDRSVFLRRHHVGPEGMRLSHLAAAAPDLFDALQLARRWIEETQETEEVLGEIRDALAKAEGRTQ